MKYKQIESIEDADLGSSQKRSYNTKKPSVKKAFSPVMPKLIAIGLAISVSILFSGPSTYPTWLGIAVVIGIAFVFYASIRPFNNTPHVNSVRIRKNTSEEIKDGSKSKKKQKWISPMYEDIALHNVWHLHKEAIESDDRFD